MASKISATKLHNAWKKYHEEIEAMEAKLKPYIEFAFFVMHQPADGFVIVSSDDASNGMLTACLAIINTKGKLSLEDYLDVTI